MGPKEAAEVLRRIAAAIENSKRPSIDMVRHDIAVVVSRLAEEQQQEQQGQQQQQQSQQQQEGQQEQEGQQQQALPKSGPGKSMINKLIKDLEMAHQKDNHNAFKEILEKLEKAAP